MRRLGRHDTRRFRIGGRVTHVPAGRLSLWIPRLRSRCHCGRQSEALWRVSGGGVQRVRVRLGVLSCEQTLKGISELLFSMLRDDDAGSAESHRQLRQYRSTTQDLFGLPSCLISDPSRLCLSKSGLVQCRPLPPHADRRAEALWNVPQC